jgi:dienelactone hydrolase
MSFRENILNCVGPMPQAVALEAELLEPVDKGSHTLQLVRYNVEQGDRINAWLLIPKKILGKTPAILAVHQHNGEFYMGKSEPAGLNKNKMYHYGLDLCLRGYVVLCPDHLCFEDRRPPEYERVESPFLNAENYERLLFMQYLLRGRTLQGKYLSDLCRGVDFLQSLSYVDPERIGAIGHSLGGQETMWLAWYDSRIKTAVSSCGFTQYINIVEERVNHNFALYTPGFLNVCDCADLVSAIAPRAFLITNGIEDYNFPICGVRKIADIASKAYAAAGVPERFQSVVFQGGHSLPPDVKTAAYDFLDKYLKT